MKQKDFYWATSPLFIPSVLMGLPLPFRCQKSSVLFHLYNVYSFAVFLAALSLTITSMPTYVSGLIAKQTAKALPIREYVNTVWWILVSLLGVLGSLLLRLRRSRIGKVLKDLARIEKRIGRGCMLGVNQRVRAYIIAQAICIAGIFTLAVGIHIHVTFFENKAFNGSLNAAGIYWLVTALIMDFQFFNFILILSRNLNVINGKMFRVYREMGGRMRDEPVVNELKFERLTFAERIAFIAELNLRHRVLADEINSIYGVFFLVQVPANLIQVIFHTYYYMEILMGVAQVENLAYNLVEVLVWAVSYLCGLTSAVAACHSATEQVQRMHYLLADMLMRCQNPQLQRQMAAAALTQLVVLIQFQQSGLN